jgi:hypothetical protein
MSTAATVVSFEPSAFVPLALGFFGLGTGYLIWGPQELAGFPHRSYRRRRVAHVPDRRGRAQLRPRLQPSPLTRPCRP